jgi:hypothetical protein
VNAEIRPIRLHLRNSTDVARRGSTDPRRCSVHVNPAAASAQRLGAFGHEARRITARSAAPTAIFQPVADGDSDEPGVLGNLPRSRPGRRSDKRGSSGDANRSGGSGSASGSGSRQSGGRSGRTSSSARAAASAQKAKRSDGGTRPSAARQSSTARAGSGGSGGASSRSSSGGSASSRADQRPRPASQQGGGDPISDAVQLAGKVAAVPVKIAVGVLKRLPRP